MNNFTFAKYNRARIFGNRVTRKRRAVQGSMSNIYITEPNTEGKVLLHTTFGDLDVELWPQQAPKACRNFVQLCLEGVRFSVSTSRDRRPLLAATDTQSLCV